MFLRSLSHLSESDCAPATTWPSTLMLLTLAEPMKFCAYGSSAVFLHPPLLCLDRYRCVDVVHCPDWSYRDVDAYYSLGEVHLGRIDVYQKGWVLQVGARDQCAFLFHRRQ